jgi:hypothetical protein
MVSCASCPTGQFCGGDGANQCGQTVCVPTTCLLAGKNCGSISDGCGATLNCGTCAAGQTCGAGGQQNVCGCVPKTCDQLGAQCGMIDNGCGGTLSCGTCSGNKTCGARKPNKCNN